MIVAESDTDRERKERQDGVIAESKALKLALLAHTVRLEAFVATLRRRPTTENGSDGTGE